MNVKKIKIEDLRNKAKDFLGKLSAKNKKLILIVLGAIVLFSVGAAVVINNKPYETLFSGLNEQEASDIIGKLQDSGVEYKYENDGTILVPRDQEQKLKAQLVYEGYPKSGFTYDIFKENIDMTTTDSEKSSYKIFELQNRIGATIGLFDGVKDAKVTIAPGENQKYVLDKDGSYDAKASVVVIMKNGGSPSPEQVKGIQRLISKSIPNMKMEEVVVLDGNGNDVSVNGDSTQISANKMKIEFEKEMDKSIKEKILNVLNPIYGADNVKVSVKSTADVDKKIREIINHTAPNAEEGKGIPSSENSDNEIVRDGEGTGGVPGTQSNAEIPVYSQIKTDGKETYIKNQNSIEYLVNQLKEQAQVDAAVIKDLTVSVAINGKTLGSLNERKLKELIAKAAGISADIQDEKIVVVAAPFYKANSKTIPDVAKNVNKNWIIIGTIAFSTLLLIFIAIILVRRKKKAKGNEIEVMMNEKVIPELTKVVQPKNENSINELLDLNNERGMELKSKIRDFSDQNPEITAQLLKVWLRGGDENGA